MPIPMDDLRNQCKSIEDLLELYAEWGWTRDLEFEWLEYDSVNGVCLLTRYSASGLNLSCGTCQANNQATVYQLRPTGLLGHCCNCAGWTSGHLSLEICEPLGTREISVDEGWEFIDRTGQYPPIGMHRDKNRKKRFIGWA